MHSFSTISSSVKGECRVRRIIVFLLSFVMYLSDRFVIQLVVLSVLKKVDGARVECKACQLDSRDLFYSCSCVCATAHIRSFVVFFGSLHASRTWCFPLLLSR